MDFRLGRLAYAFTGVPALFGAFVIAGLIQLGRLQSGWMGFLSLLLLAGAMLAVAARFRDIGRSGWWTLLVMIPVLGPLTALALVFWPPKRVSDTEGSAA